MENNQILNNVDEKIAYNCLIFSKRQYIDYLELMLNDIAYLESISFQNPDSELLELEEIEASFSISLEKGKEYIQKKIRELSNKDKLDNFEQRLNELHIQFKNDRSGESFSDFQRKLDDINDGILEINKDDLPDELLQKLHKIENSIKSYKEELKTILDTFVKDERYEVIVDNLFDTNRLWQSPYGNYNFNPFFKKEKEIKDSDIEYIPFESCKYLPKLQYQTPFSKFFAPLVFKDLLFISKDAVSISIINSQHEEISRISTKSDILASGAIMFFKENYYLIVPCRNSINIISSSEVIYEVPYGFSIENGYMVKDITVFNNVAYVLVSDFLKNRSIVYVIHYDFYNKEFKYRQRKEFEPRILSNIFIIHDYDNECFHAGYILEDNSLQLVDLDSFDVVSKMKVSILPIDMGYELTIKGIKLEFKYSYPIVVRDSNLYYLGYAKNNDFLLYKFNPLDQEEEKLVLPPYHRLAPNDKGFMQSFTNLVVTDEKAYLSGIFDKEILEISLNNKKLQMRKETSEHKGYNYLIAYSNGAYCINEGEREPLEYSIDSIVAVWNGHIITRRPEKDGYILLIEK